MSIQKLGSGDVTSHTIVTNPIRTYTSSSILGVTGSVYVFAERSPIEKDDQFVSSFVDHTYHDEDISSVLQNLQATGKVVRHNPLANYVTDQNPVVSVDLSTWTLTNVTRVLGQSDPDGGTTAVKITVNAFPFTGASHKIVASSITGLSNAPLILKLRVKNSTVGFVRVGMSDGSGANVNLSSGTISGVVGGASSASIVDLGSGWYEVTVRYNNFAGALTSTPAVFLTNSAFVDNLSNGSGAVFIDATEPILSYVPKSRFFCMLSEYFNVVDALPDSVKKSKVLDVDRFTPSYTFTQNTLKKLLVKDTLNSYYRVSYPSAHWAYTNYNSINFFTASSVPEGSALLYPNIDKGPDHDGYVTGSYVMSGAFSFDFYINPRYQGLGDVDFKAGTILHLSSCYAVSMITGSQKDENGKPAAFRLQLQLSHSADIPPSVATSLASIGAFPYDLIFISDDNILKWNNWHHVVIRWGTDLVNDGTGSFNVDGVDRGTFVVNAGTVAPLLFGTPPGVLVVGNYYDGFDDARYFFAADPALRDGLEELSSVTSTDEPSFYTMTHPLNAELHDVSIKRYYMSDDDIAASASMGPPFIDDSIAFYLPPFFVEESPLRQFVGDHGGILQTPFFEVDGTTNDPFNVAMSFGVAGHYINIENFLKDFASDVFPRVHRMTGTAIASTTEARSANDFIYDDPYNIRRNLLLLPCDDGKFVPAFELIASESMVSNAVDDLGVEEFSLINLDNLVSTSSLLFGTSFETGPDDVTDDATVMNTFVSQSIGFGPENPSESPGQAFLNHVSRVDDAIASGTFDPGIQLGAPLTIYQRTRDPSSNQVTFFSLSNLFYGKRILPGTFELRDTSFSGSAEAFGITLKDDGRGNIYRADCLTSASTWNSVGNIYYDEGLIVIKSPHLYFFGKDAYEMSFRGEQNVHVMKIETVAPANQLNSSSNPSFLPVSASIFTNDYDRNFVYITNLNFHDENLNVVMKAQLAQPLTKRFGERFVIRLAHDF